MTAPRGQRLAAWAIGILLLASVGCKERLADVPGELVGIWETDHRGYRGRSLEIRQDLLRFGTGEGEADSYTVIGSTRQESDSGVGYAIVFQDSELDEARLHLIYDPSAKSFCLKNRPQVKWRLRGATQPENLASEPRPGGSSHAD